MTLFDAIPLHRVADPVTSKEAAQRVAPMVRGIEAQVLAELEKRGPLGGTSHELADALNLSLVTVSPRLAPMKRRQLVANSGRKREGRIVWVAL